MARFACAASLTCVEIGRLEGQRAIFSALAISPNGERVLAGADDGSLGLWDLCRVGCGRWPGTTRAWGPVAFASDGRWAVSGGSDRMVRVWDS